MVNNLKNINFLFLVYVEFSSDFYPYNEKNDMKTTIFSSFA